MVINIYFSLAPLVPLLIFTSSTWRRIKFEHNQVCQNNEESTTIQQFLTNNSRPSDCTRINVYYHWRIQWGRRRHVPPPPPGSNSFIFTYVFAKKCPRWRSVPPPTARHPTSMGNPGSATDYNREEEQPATMQVAVILALPTFDCSLVQKILLVRIYLPFYICNGYKSQSKCFQSGRSYFHLLLWSHRITWLGI